MGIPSFYRHLCRRFPKLILQAHNRSEWLCLDFNCAMYHVLRTMPPPPTDLCTWETDLCVAIAAYMNTIIEVAPPTKGVYVSCDGVVCAAKRRQQRLRRFKGPWIAALEARVTHTPLDPHKWDQNALTPGSAFMAQLGAVLTKAGAALSKKLGISVIVSTTKEPGEGEHKLMAHMRQVRPASCTIYGLDADLILLAMLLGADTGADVHLLREAQEFEKGSGGVEKGSGTWRTLSIGGLVDALRVKHHIRDFVAAMSLLGNDFLPRSLTHTVRDDGIPALIATLESHVWSHGLSIVNEDNRLDRAGVVALLASWAATEEEDIRCVAIAARKAAHRHSGVGATPEETALREWNAQPARWANVCAILDPSATGLAPSWPAIYQSWRPGSAEHYAAGLAWVWDYYSGRPVDQSWFFDEHLPPRWSDLTTYLSASTAPSLESPRIEYPTPLPEWLHLLAVLPAESVARLQPPNVQRIMAKYPWYWPTTWSIFDIGKTQMWECEPVIPIIPESVLRAMKS